MLFLYQAFKSGSSEGFLPIHLALAPIALVALTELVLAILLFISPSNEDTSMSSDVLEAPEDSWKTSIIIIMEIY